MAADRSRLGDLVAGALALDLTLLGLSALLFLAPPREDRSQEEKSAAAYRAYSKELDDFRIGPAECRSERDLDELEAALAGPLRPPHEYAARWKDTAAVRLYRKWLVDAALVRRHRFEQAERYDDLTRRGEEYLLAPRYDAAWVARSAEILAAGRNRQSGPVPGSPALPVRRGKMLEYKAVQDSDDVRRAEADWEVTARRLTGWPDYFELLAAIGRGIHSLPLALAVNYY